MKPENQERLEEAGWRIGSADEFLELTAEESALLDMKGALGAQLRERRRSLGMTQSVLAERVGSSQSRVAKMEAGEPTVTLDLLVRALLAIGASTEDVAGAIAGPTLHASM